MSLEKGRKPMSKFDRENEDVFQIVRNNPRRRGVIQDLGCVVPVDQVIEFAQFRASRKKGSGMGEIILTAVLILGILATAVAAFL